MRLQKKDPKFPSRKRMRIDHFEGWDLRKSLGDMVRKLRRIDKDAGTYDEVVKERDGTIIHETHESLRDHQGHGSAKLRQAKKMRRGNS
jgi:hypothetical protein